MELAPLGSKLTEYQDWGRGVRGHRCTELPLAIERAKLGVSIVVAASNHLLEHHGMMCLIHNSAGSPTMPPGGLSLHPM